MRKRIILAVAIPVLLLGLAAMIFAGNRMIETRQMYQEGSAAYEELNNQVRKFNAGAAALPETGTQESPKGIHDSPKETQDIQKEKTRIYIPGIEIDFEKLREINKDSTAWLYSPDTVIDYPVMEASDYYYYLNHLTDGTVNANGSLFIDYNNASDFSDLLTVIYGHHMKSGNMFGSLVEYKKQDYFEQHPHMYLYTEHENYRIDLLYGFVIGAEQWRENAFMFAENVENLLTFARDNTTFESGAVYGEGDRIAALSTCSYEFNEARYVVVGVLRPEWS